MKVSVVIATYNRAHLIERALECYARQSMSPGDFELIYVDDWSQDWTDKLLRDWSQHLNIVSIRPGYKPPDKWRDTGSIINLGIRAAKGEVIIPTHPEVMVGKESLRKIYEHRTEMAYHCCKVYYLTPDNQEKLDTVNWQENLLNVRQLPDFYNQPEREGHNNDYLHHATDRHTTWGSWVFGGHTRKTWQFLGGLTEFETWGSVDVDYLNRRNILNIRNITELDEDTIVVHQNHDREDPRNPHYKPTNRDMNAAMGALTVYHTPESARKSYLWT